MDVEKREHKYEEKSDFPHTVASAPNRATDHHQTSVYDEVCGIPSDR